MRAEFNVWGTKPKKGEPDAPFDVHYIMYDTNDKTAKYPPR
jgi:hypothetical protein